MNIRKKSQLDSESVYIVTLCFLFTFMHMEFRLDRSAFSISKRSDQGRHTHYWLSKTPTERFRAAFYLSCRAYGLDPNSFPRMDKSMFRIKER